MAQLGGRYGEGMIYVEHEELQRSIKVLSKKLEKVMGKYFSNEAVKEIFVANAEGFREAIAREAPQRTTPYPRPKQKVNAVTGKKSRKRRRQPGTLKKSITVFPARDEDDTTVYIGPRRKGAKFGDKKADGFYGYFQNYGTGRGVKALKFIQKAYSAENNRISRKIIDDLYKRVEKADRELNGTST